MHNKKNYVPVTSFRNRMQRQLNTVCLCHCVVFGANYFKKKNKCKKKMSTIALVYVVGID